MQVSSITASSANVSWTAASGAQWYYVYYKPVGSGSALNETVMGTSINLSELDGCTDYEVTIRTYCDVNDVSDATSPVEFETGNNNPDATITLETDEVDYGCSVVLSGVEGYDYYIWSDGNTTHGSTDTNGILVNKADAYTLIVEDGNCADTADYVLSASQLEANCISFDYEAELIDSMYANESSYRQKTICLAKGLAGVMEHDTVKTLVKTIALDSDIDPAEIVRLDILIDSCDNYGVDLVDLMKTALHNNGGSSSDTAALAMIADGFTLDASTDAEVYPAIWYGYLGSDLQDDAYPSWDSLSADYVVASAMKDTTQDDNLYYLDTDGVTVLNKQEPENYHAYAKPVWEVVYILDRDIYSNQFNWVDDVALGAAKRCTCYHIKGREKPGCRASMNGGCNGQALQGQCDSDCTRLQRIGTWLWNAIH